MHVTSASFVDGSGATHDDQRTSLDGRRWLAVGATAEAGSRRAGLAAARAAARSDDIALVMVFCAARHDPDAVLAGIGEVVGAVPLIGCSTAAVIGPAGSADDAGVVVVALGGPGFSVSTGLSRDTEGRQRDAGAEVAGCVAGLDDRPYRALVLLTDGLVAGTEEVVAGAYGVIGASMPMIGGAACPDQTTAATFQFYGDQVVRNAVVGAAIASDGPFGVGLRHGWRKVGEPMIVTKSSHNEVYTLDDQPAAEAYLRRLGAPAAAYTDPETFETFAERRPIGVRSRSGEVVRNVGSSARLHRGWLHSSGDVPEGGLIWPMEGDAGTVLQAAADACVDAAADLGDRAPLGLIAFDCETRARFLDADGRREEVARMVAHARPAPLAGLYTWGEIARTKGINGFHNQTLVVLAVS